MENWDLVNLEISGNRNDSFSVIPTNSGGRNKPLGDFLVVSKTGKSGTLSTGGHAKDMLGSLKNLPKLLFQGFS